MSQRSYLRNKVGIATILLSMLMVFAVVSNGFATDSAGPTVKAFSPAKDTTLNQPSTSVSGTIYDPDGIQSATLLVNGTTVSSSFDYTARHFIATGYDTCSGEQYGYWVIDNYNEATISAYLTNLKDGAQSIQVQVKDTLGNVVTKDVTNFNVVVKPLISELQPVNGAQLSKNTVISAKITDNDTVDAASIEMSLDGAKVAATFNATTGIASYTSPTPLPDGVHNVILNAKDKAGNSATTATSKYTVRSVGPCLTFADADKKFNTASQNLTIGLSSNVNLATNTVTNYSVFIDNKLVPAYFEYKGYMYYAYEDDPGTFVVSDYTSGTINCPVNLKNGNSYTLKVIAKDSLGNSTTQEWKFGVGVLPVVTDKTPTGYVDNVPVVQAKVASSNGSVLDNESILMTIDNNRVAFQTVYDATGKVTVSYSSAALSDDRKHDVTLSAKDTDGNAITTTWSFTGLLIGTTTGFTGKSPNTSDVVTTAQPTIKAHFTDLAQIYNVAGAGITIDGLAPMLSAQGYDPDYGYYPYKYPRPPVVAGTAREYTLSYVTEKLGDGPHTVTITIPSKDGVTPAFVESWVFQVKVPPVIRKVTPEKATATNLPTIITFSTDNGGLKADGTGSATNPAAFSKGILTIDNGTPVALKIDSANQAGRMSYKVTTPLSEGNHTVKFVVYDAVGEVATKEWNLNVVTLGLVVPDMPLMSAEKNLTCLSCHPTTAPILGGKHPTVTLCGSCHSTMVYSTAAFNQCTYCHYDNRPANYTKYYSYRHTSDGSIAFENIDFSKHNIKDVHVSDTEGCEQCHSRVLTNEHNRPDRLDSNGKPINCDTCHTSSNAAVKAAIASRDTKCSACHVSNHEAKHDYKDFDQNCLGCHDANLSKEHIEHAKRPGGKSLTCGDCHNSSRNEVKRAISSDNLNCAGCHNQAHNISLADVAPAAIPKYDKFNFTGPLEASIFAADPGAPAGYENGQVIISNRRTDVTAQEIWDKYNTGLLATGYTLKSGAYVTGSKSFTAEFVYAEKAVTVQCFNTEIIIGGNTVGYRVQIWYK